ncbi:MAG TPA: tail assembly chaperone [Balneolaceae bacterium]|nr:tail assembly chaperone [Balneolaceae bacterium]
MANYEIDGKEYELKLDFKAVSEINKKYDSALEFVGEVMQGNFNSFIDVVYYGLYHAGKGFSRKQIEKDVEQKFEAEQLDLDFILKTGNEVVADNFFFRKTVKKMMNQDPEAQKQFEALVK